MDAGGAAPAPASSGQIADGGVHRPVRLVSSLRPTQGYLPFNWRRHHHHQLWAWLRAQDSGKRSATSSKDVAAFDAILWNTVSEMSPDEEAQNTREAPAVISPLSRPVISPIPPSSLVSWFTHRTCAVCADIECFLYVDVSDSTHVDEIQGGAQESQTSPMHAWWRFCQCPCLSKFRSKTMCFIKVLSDTDIYQIHQ